MIRRSLLTLSLLLASAGAASAQFPRSRGPADPRYFPDLYKGPAWGMTLSEYYTFGNKADGPYGYALAGYRSGSNDDILRWKQATGTALPPGYYLQRWRERRAGNPQPASNPSALRQPQQPLAARRMEPREEPQETNAIADDQEEENANEEIQETEPTPAPRTSRRNAGARGLTTEHSANANSAKSLELTGPAQSDVRIHTSNKFRRIRAIDPSSGDDKN